MDLHDGLDEDLELSSEHQCMSNSWIARGYLLDVYDAVGVVVYWRSAIYLSNAKRGTHKAEGARGGKVASNVDGDKFVHFLGSAQAEGSMNLSEVKWLKL